MLLLCGVPMASSAELQLTGEIGLYVTDEELGHEPMIAMLATASRVAAKIAAWPHACRNRYRAS